MTVGLVLLAGGLIVVIGSCALGLLAGWLERRYSDEPPIAHQERRAQRDLRSGTR